VVLTNQNQCNSTFYETTMTIALVSMLSEASACKGLRSEVMTKMGLCSQVVVRKWEKFRSD
jgi:hypothetical protein